MMILWLIRNLFLISYPLFLGVTNDFTIEKIKTTSLDKWKTKLNDEQLRMIRKISLATTV
jgi:hypothetical protein